MPKKKWAFYCGGVAKLRNLLPMLRKKHIFLCFPCSVRMTFLKLTWPLRWKWHFLRGGESCCSCGAEQVFSSWCYFLDVLTKMSLSPQPQAISELDVKLLILSNASTWLEHEGSKFMCKFMCRNGRKRFYSPNKGFSLGRGSYLVCIELPFNSRIPRRRWLA